MTEVATTALIISPTAPFAQPGVDDDRYRPLSISLDSIWERLRPVKPVDGGWSSWGEWSECSATCGDSSRQIRVRICDNPKPRDGGVDCKGQRKEKQKCENLPKCDPCKDDPSSCINFRCQMERNMLVPKQSGTLNQMGCCRGEAFNMTTNFCDEKQKLKKCIRDDNRTFVCDNLNCIEKSKICDSVNDCSDGSDEAGCGRCDKDHFKCGTTQQCVPLTALCDSNKDCGDGSDESNCVRFEGDWCKPNEFWCSISDMCVRLTQVCDGTKDCGEGEDEEGCRQHCDSTVQDCRSVKCPSGQEEWTIPVQNNATQWSCCRGDVFNKRTHICTGLGTKRCESFASLTCANGNCVPKQWRCDGDNDCSDGTDETGCGTCRRGQFKCAKTGVCVEKSLVCDGVMNCVDSGSDEVGCATPSGHWCGPKQFACRNSQCISASGICNGRDECGDASDEANCSIKYTPPPTTPPPPTTTTTRLPQTCGERRFSARNSISRIIGGTKATRGSWPWMVQLWNAHLKGYCGAALISDEWVVTAAHCVYIQAQLYHVEIDNFEDLLNYLRTETIVKIGKHNSRVDEDFEELYRVSDVVVHPDYEGADHQNDIALLKLSFPEDERLNFKPHIQPICVGTEQFYQSTVFDHLHHYSGWVGGWGSLRAGGGSTAVLQEVRLPLVSTPICRAALSPRPVADHMFCAGFRTGGRDTCQGDSGGPYMIDIDGRWHLLGVISWGRGCALPNRYGVYINVGHYYDWILDTIKEYED